MQLFSWSGLVPAYLVVCSTAGAAPVVTEADVLASLMDAHPAVVEVSRQLPQAMAELGAIRTYANPELEVLREDLRGPEVETEWALSWQLPSRKRRLEIAAAEQSVEAAAAAVDQDLRSLRATLREDYADWALAAARQQLLAEARSRLVVLATREKTRAEKGEASPLEAHRLHLAAANLASQLALTKAEETRAQARVARWLPRLDPKARPELPPLPHSSIEEEVAAADQATAGLASKHPILAMARAELKASELELAVSKRYLASPELIIGWKRQESLAADNSGPLLGLSWTLPLFDRQQATRAAATAKLEATQARATLQAREIETGIVAAKIRYAELIQGSKEAKKALGPNAAMLVGAETAFRYGELPLTDFLETQKAATEGELAWLSLYTAALHAHRELELLTGPIIATPDRKETTP